ncbi:hypothetical protein A3C18_01425 [Candidatus Kaiserbacteria bacterium RIFCSPHIGHO2_02_FULL_54_11b]|uniref:Uncharacterized protein n=2 Tax=Candidatus Kaiseribacteriota TaxID=1752734 RepID=A0A1F6CMW4_9BACT|nr:MAG: hypothetical protein A2704_05575 [Candidatus Kaiserbacteria bacterium RIFCSPHIGHO2_01_FULL_54_36b]OGG64075.1 MAG: hypothetical protein A3C18_01425 [Candidatus Kaiserbacteria bacterium RIFCSPHIGHO2_02_FULL_54_11b]
MNIYGYPTTPNFARVTGLASRVATLETFGLSSRPAARGSSPMFGTSIEKDQHKAGLFLR